MAGNPFTVLLVEPGNVHKELIVRDLNGKDKKFDHVVDGESAVDYLFRLGEYADRKESPLPDLILLNLRLPKMNGQEVLKMIKAADNLRRIPVVVLTTSESDDDLEMAYSNGAISFLVKPVDYDELLRLISDTADEWLERIRSVTSVEPACDQA